MALKRCAGRRIRIKIALRMAVSGVYNMWRWTVVLASAMLLAKSVV